MARYFLHLRDGHDELLDPDGIEAAEDAISGLALQSARDCMARDIESGRLDLHYRIDVHNEAGELVHSVSFKDAVAIAG